MKKTLFTVAGLLSLAYGQGRFQTATDTRIVTTPETKLVFDNVNVEHNSQAPQINGVLRFTGNTTTKFYGANPQQVYALEIEKSGGAELQLQQQVAVDGNIRFVNGLLNLQHSVVQLNTLAKLLNETETNRAYTLGEGYFTTTVNLNAPSLANAGNLGVFITSPANLGAVTIKRGHKPQTGTGLANSISRYYDIVPATNAAFNATVELLYFDAELNNQDEGSLSLFQSTNGGAGWTSLGFDQKSATDNYLRKIGLSGLYRYTLSSASGTTLPVSGLDFTAKRLNGQVVQLAWKTVQETENKGFYLERKKEGEPAFSVVHFAPSKGLNGNSNAPLHYLHVDPNAFEGKTYYRLKQEDLKGAHTYSLVQVVDGNALKAVTMKAWPIPAIREFSVAVQGVEKDRLQVYDISGRLQYETNITEGQTIKISNLAPGTYILRLLNAPELVQKVVVL